MNEIGGRNIDLQEGIGGFGLPGGVVVHYDNSDGRIFASQHLADLHPVRRVHKVTEDGDANVILGNGSERSFYRRVHHREAGITENFLATGNVSLAYPDVQNDL